jgi:hypothetical protein
MDAFIHTHSAHSPWNKGKLTGQPKNRRDDPG